LRGKEFVRVADIRLNSPSIATIDGDFRLVRNDSGRNACGAPLDEHDQDVFRASILMSPRRRDE